MSRLRELDLVQRNISLRFHPGDCHQTQVHGRSYKLVLHPASPEDVRKIRSILWDEYAAYDVLIVDDRTIYFNLQAVV
jgi:hypothetical protein